LIENPHDPRVFLSGRAGCSPFHGVAAGCGQRSPVGGLTTAVSGAGELTGIRQRGPSGHGPIQVGWGTSARAQRCCGFQTSIRSSCVKPVFWGYEQRARDGGVDHVQQRSPEHVTTPTFKDHLGGGVSSGSRLLATDKAQHSVSQGWTAKRHMPADYTPNLPKPQGGSPIAAAFLVGPAIEGSSD